MSDGQERSGTVPTARPPSTRRLLAFALLFTGLALYNSFSFALVAGAETTAGIPAGAWLDFALGALMAFAAAWHWHAWRLARASHRGGPTSAS